MLAGRCSVRTPALGGPGSVVAGVRPRTCHEPPSLSGRRSAYTYDSTGRLFTVTPPGLAAWTLNYNASHRLSSVGRPDGSDNTTTTVAYGIPISGSSAPNGKTIELRLPAASSSGGTAGATITSYYTATGTGPCVSVALAGMLCSTGPAAQPTTGNPLGAAIAGPIGVALGAAL